MLTGDEHIGPEDSLENNTGQPPSPFAGQPEHQFAQAPAEQVSAEEVPAADPSSGTPSGTPSPGGGSAPSPEATDPSSGAPSGAQSSGAAEVGQTAQNGARPRRRILIGSQRDPAAYRRRLRDWIPVVKPDYEAPQSPAEGEDSPQPSLPQSSASHARRPKSSPHSQKRPRKRPRAKPGHGPTVHGQSPPAAQAPASAPEAAAQGLAQVLGEALTAASSSLPPQGDSAPGPAVNAAAGAETSQSVLGAPISGAKPLRAEPAQVSEPLLARPAGEPLQSHAAPEELASRVAPVVPGDAAAEPDAAAMASELMQAVAASLAGAPPAAAGPPVPLPNLREQLPGELEAEYEQALGDTPLEELIDRAGTEAAPLVPETRHPGRIVAVGREYVFVDLGRREQGRLALRQFEEPPQVGSTLEVVVERFNEPDGLYELALPNTAVEVDDWGDLAEGMLVEARVTGYNTGGLECEVNRIRGFIPISQIALYRVEGLEQFVGERFTCVVSEANRARRNLVLSRRAVLEREQQEARQRLLDSLEPGQVREGVVRKLTEFGAFVDLGGVDGLVHVSRLAWHRVEDPREVLQEGQHIKVKVEKVDRATGRISLSYRDMVENPWQRVAEKYQPNSVISGRVTRLMDFGAFVQLEPGVEGLVHISELASRRVWRASDVVSEGQEVEVLVLSVDAEAQRISLSMKVLEPKPQPAPAAADEQPAEQPAAAPSKPKKRKPSPPLAGGLERAPGGERFGLKW